jgi:hypothetical protein
LNQLRVVSCQAGDIWKGYQLAVVSFQLSGWADKIREEVLRSKSGGNMNLGSNKNEVFLSIRGFLKKAKK